MAYNVGNDLFTDLQKVVEVITKILSVKNQASNESLFDEWALQFIDKDELFMPKGELKAITFCDSSKITSRYGVYILETFFEECYSLKNGLQSLACAIGANINKDVDLVTKIIFKDDRVHTIETQNKTREIKDDIVVLAAPPGNIAIENNDELYKRLQKITYTSCHVAYFKVNKTFPDKPSIIFYPQSNQPIGVIEQFLLGRENYIGCIIPTIKPQDKEEVIEYAKKELSDIFEYDIQQCTTQTYCEYWTHGLPCVTPKFITNVQYLQSMQYDNFVMAGDYITMFPSMDSAIKSGVAGANRINTIM